MLLRELFENILLEYNREKTAATFGNKLLKALMTDRSILPSALGTARAYLVQKEKIGEPIEPNTRQVIINDVLGVIESGDPTQHKEYSQWLVKCYANENIILEDIISKGLDWLETYNQMKIRKILPAEYRDIMKLKFNDLYGIVSNQELVAKLNQEPEEVDKGSSKVVLNNENVRIINPENREAACYYGQGTTWCTAARTNNYYDYYAKNGDLFILLPKKPNYDGEKYQVHFSSNQFMDETDNPVDVGWLLKERFGNLVEFFKSVDPSITEHIQFADPETFKKLMGEIKDVSIDYVDQILNEWEMEDEYYHSWLADNGYQDEDGDIDWDQVEKDNMNWMNYNSEAQTWYVRAIECLSPTVSELSDVITDFIDIRGENPTLINLDRLVGDYVESEMSSYSRDSSDAGLGQWIRDNVIIKKHGNEYKVTAREIK